MKLWCCFPTTNEIQSVDIPDTEMSKAIRPEFLELLNAGHPVFVHDRWVFKDTLETKHGSKNVIELKLTIKAGITPKDGSPGSMDCFWLEIWDTEELIKRDACGNMEGVLIDMRQKAGQVR